MKKTQILLIVLLILSVSGLTQTNDIEFRYDENGNRIRRIILDISNKSLAATDTTDYNEEALKEKLSKKDELGDTQIIFFPNPVKEWLNIEVSGTENWEIGEYKLFNNNGKQLGQGELKSDNRLNFNQYSPGLYLLEIEVDGKKRVWKVIKD